MNVRCRISFQQRKYSGSNEELLVSEKLELLLFHFVVQYRSEALTENYFDFRCLTLNTYKYIYMYSK